MWTWTSVYLCMFVMLSTPLYIILLFISVVLFIESEYLGNVSPWLQVHQLMCTDLMNLVDRVLKILPEIEAARPCKAGRDALCSINLAIEKAKSVLLDCSESSKLYLVCSLQSSNRKKVNNIKYIFSWIFFSCESIITMVKYLRFSNSFKKETIK